MKISVNLIFIKLTVSIKLIKLVVSNESNRLYSKRVELFPNNFQLITLQSVLLFT